MIDFKGFIPLAGHGALIIGALGIIALPSVCAQQVVEPAVQSVEVPPTAAAAGETAVDEAGLPLSEQERTERAQTRALNASITAKLNAIAAANKAAQEEYQRHMEAYQREVERREAANRAAAVAAQQQAAREKAAWEARVAACKKGRRSQCKPQ